jgi:hypothetical protein
VFLVVAEDDAYAGYGGNLLGVVLGEAADDGHGGVGVLGNGLPDGVTAFFFCYRGYGAGVYYVYVGLLVEVYYDETSGGEFFLQVAGFGKIKFASEGVGCDVHAS